MHGDWNCTLRMDDDTILRLCIFKTTLDTRSCPPASALEEKATTETFAWVDALRGIAILGVVCCHCFYDRMPWFICHLNVAQWVMSGRFGVQLFFVASAFTLAWSWNRRKSECHPTKNFLIRRFCRIAPLYFAGILAYAMMSFCFQNGLHGITAGAYTPQSVAANLFFIHGWLPFAMNNVVPGGWSIGVEMSFYLLVPWLATHLCRPTRSLAAFMVSLPLAILCAWLAHHALARFRRDLTLAAWTGPWATTAHSSISGSPPKCRFFCLAFLLTEWTAGEILTVAWR